MRDWVASGWESSDYTSHVHTKETEFVDCRGMNISPTENTKRRALTIVKAMALRSQMAVIWTPILNTSGLSFTKCVIIFFINRTKLLTIYLTPLVEWLTIHDESLVLRMWSSVFTLQPRNARFWHVEAHDKYILFSMFTIYSSCMQKEMNGVRFFYTNLVIRHQSAYFIHTVLWYFKWGRSTPLPCQQRSTIRLLQSQ